MTISSPREIGNRLYKLRHLLGMADRGGQAQLAAEMRTDPRTYSNWERGYGRPPLEAIGLIIDRRLPALTLDYIFRGVEGALTEDLMLRLREAPDRPEFVKP